MGGTVKVESEGRGHGTKFIIVLSAYAKLNPHHINLE